MSLARRSSLALLGTVAAFYSPVLGGCVSSTPNPGSGGEDSSVPLEDTGLPAQGDASQPDSTLAPAPDSGTPDGSVPDTSVVDTAAPPTSLIRFAWFVGGQPLLVDGGPATPAELYDVCVAPHGTGAWQGPILAKASFPGGLNPFDVTSYFTVVPGQYDVRVVLAGSTTCDLPDAGTPDAGAEDAATDAGDAGLPVPPNDFTSFPPLEPGNALTVVFVDPSATSATIVDAFAFMDQTTTSAGKVKVRFLNVSRSDITVPNTVDAGPDASDDAGTTLLGADFGIGGGVVWNPLFTDVTSQAGAAPATGGYVETTPLSDLDMTLVTQSGTEATGQTFTTDEITLGPAGILTAFYATEPGGASGPGSSPMLVWCYDGQPSTTNALLTHCEHTNQSSDSTASETRFGNFLADSKAPAVDMCLKLHSYGGYSGPLFVNAGVPAGLPPESLSGYFPVHGGYSYDARFVAAGSTDCSTSLTDGTFMAFSEPGGGGYTSVLFTGYTSVPEDAGVVPPYDAGPPLDAGEEAGEDAGPQPVSVGLTSIARTMVAIQDESFAAPAVASVRVVHVAADDPDPISLSFVVSGQTTTWSIVNVPYGGFGTEPGPVDPYGYETMAAGSMTVTLDTFSASYAMGTDETTMFVAHGANGGAEILVCNDYYEDSFSVASPTYADCCVLGSGTGNCAGPSGPSGPIGPSGSSGPQP